MAGLNVTQHLTIRSNEMALKIELTVPEVNTIIRSLGKHPFDEINQLITKISQQGSEQLAAQQAEQQAQAEQAPAETPAQ